jgi:ribosomal protein L37E
MSEAELKERHAPAPAGSAPAATGSAVACRRCGPGESISDPRPGDVVLIRGTGWLGKSIRFFIRMRCRRNGDRSLAHWSHAGIIVSPQGHLIEVIHTGVVISRLENYRDQEYHYVYLDLSAADRTRASSYAYSCLRQKYGRLSFILFALAVLTGDWFEVPDRGQQGCVALIVRALQRAGVRFARRPTDMTPADLAKNFGVMP